MEDFSKVKPAQHALGAWHQMFEMLLHLKPEWKGGHGGRGDDGGDGGGVCE